MDYPTTANEAIEQGVKFYLTGKPCKRGHLVPRHAATRNCTQCAKEWRQKLRASDSYKEYQRQYQAAYRLTEKGYANIDRANKKWRGKE